MYTLTQYQDLFEDYLNSKAWLRRPENLYDPIQYILTLGGKRMRPMLTLMGAEIFGASAKDALPAALAVEMFHNFSLVHDDIMDAAPLRRGQETVHTKWNLNTAILSGDAMLILAYQYFESYEPIVFRDLAKLFSKTALEVCEGQQMDIDFEKRADVTEQEYLKMIEYKTAVLVGAAMEMGAIIANANAEQKKAIYAFGNNLGIAFQLQDDYLDAFGDPKTFGKQVGGDIIENKKTYLYLKALEFGNADQQKAVQDWFTQMPQDPTSKIEAVKALFVSTGAAEATQNAIKHYTMEAFAVMDAISLDEDKKALLRQVGEKLMGRTV